MQVEYGRARGNAPDDFEEYWMGIVEKLDASDEVNCEVCKDLILKIAPQTHHKVAAHGGQEGNVCQANCAIFLCNVRLVVCRNGRNLKQHP